MINPTIAASRARLTSSFNPSRKMLLSRSIPPLAFLAVEREPGQRKQDHQDDGERQEITAEVR